LHASIIIGSIIELLYLSNNNDHASATHRRQ